MGDVAIKFRLILDELWECRWPRPSTNIQDVYREVALKAGKLDITDLVDLGFATTELWFKGTLNEAYIFWDIEAGKAWRSLPFLSVALSSR